MATSEFDSSLSSVSSSSSSSDFSSHLSEHEEEAVIGPYMYKPLESDHESGEEVDAQPDAHADEWRKEVGNLDPWYDDC